MKGPFLAVHDQVVPSFERYFALLGCTFEAVTDNVLLTALRAG